VARWRRPGSGEIILVFLLLAMAGAIWDWLSHSHITQNPLGSYLITAFLAWRVSRGGRISRVLLILGSELSYAKAALSIAAAWDVTVAVQLTLYAAQIALLISLPVYGRTRPAPVLVRARGWARLLPRPPAWLLACGLAAGLLVTLACLGNMDFIPLAGCRPAGSSACVAVGEGYPLRWLTAHDNVPLILKRPLLKDFAQWVLVSTSVLYLGWRWLVIPEEGREAAG
jgi:hypothetical protein